jgi:DNA-binding CsgD family transcriptional regulator
MNEREIRLCILFLIGLPYAEIAKTLYRAESGIGKDKYLVSKRLGVTVKSLQTTLFEIASAD